MESFQGIPTNTMATPALTNKLTVLKSPILAVATLTAQAIINAV